MKRSLILGLIFFCTRSLLAQDTAHSFFFVRTTRPMPFMEFGLGDDRLGGAKMTYLDSNLIMKVVDSSGTDYKVQLSRYHSAYIAKTNVKIDSVTLPKPYYLSSSFRVYGDERHDYVAIMMEERLPYRSIQQIDPSRIAVDIFGVTTNTNWITQLETVKEIRNVWYEQTEDDVMRVYIDLKHRQHWGHFIQYDSSGKRLLIRVKREPSSVKPKHLFIAIDAGHGGTNGGATGVSSKILEKDYTLRFAKTLEKYLKRKKVKVYMTRNEDAELSMIDRALALRSQDPDLLVSLHLNSSANPSINGTSTYYRYIGFRSLSQFVLKRMLQLGLNNFGNVGAFNFALSGPTEYPNCLVEIAFLSNLEDEKKILDPSFHRAVARKIYRGIRDWSKKLD
jgi:N-acetylmuramoyl-L-alanine amidase